MQTKEAQVLDAKQIHFFFDPDTPPAAYADSGDSVVFRCEDCYAGQLDCDGKDFSLLDMERNNPITGPLFVRGAEPGDLLRIDIEHIDVESSGSMCVRKGVGAYAVQGSHCRRFPIEGDALRFDGGLKIPLCPMLGVIGVCPAGAPVSAQCPGEHGGNLDIRELGAGSSLYLPVSLPGALLCAGDLHAVQGDGETAICALEVSGSVRLRVHVCKGRDPLPTPFIVNADACYTAAAAESLDVCSVAAARKMQRFLMEYTNLDDAQAAMLLSLAGHLRISQIVNPLKGCYMELPRSILAQIQNRDFPV